MEWNFYSGWMHVIFGPSTCVHVQYTPIREGTFKILERIAEVKTEAQLSFFIALDLKRSKRACIFI